jgi:hypothetical protein
MRKRQQIRVITRWLTTTEIQEEQKANKPLTVIVLRSTGGQRLDFEQEAQRSRLPPRPPHSTIRTARPLV